MKLGDTVKKVTDALGIPQCDECKKRQEKLNAMFSESWSEHDQRVLDRWLLIAKTYKELNLDSLHDQVSARANLMLERKNRVLGIT